MTTELREDLYIVPGLVNVYLLDLPGGLTLVDTGFPRDTSKILEGIGAIGKRPDDLRHILLTHAHPDHIGGAAALQRRTGAQVYAHRADAPIIEAGGPFRPIVPAPGWRNRIVVALISKLFKRVAPASVDYLLKTALRCRLPTISSPSTSQGTALDRSHSTGGRDRVCCSLPTPASTASIWFSRQHRKMSTRLDGAWLSSPA